jgi:hypothetical protein
MGRAQAGEAWQVEKAGLEFRKKAVRFVLKSGKFARV